MKYWIFVLLFSFCSLFAYEQHYESLRIAKIEVVTENLSPDLAFSPSTLLSRLHTKVGNLFSQVEFDRDLKMLAEEYDHVEPTIELTNNELYLTLKIWFKPTIRTIEFCGNERLSSKKLLKKLGIKTNSLFDREAFIKAFNELKLLYIKKGYFEAELNYEIIPSEDRCGVDIRITVCEGRAGKINEICLHGCTSSEESALLEEMVSKPYNLFLSWYTGRGIYHPDMIEHDRLSAINFFQNRGYADALVTLCVEPLPDCDRINVILTVEKGSCYRIGGIVMTGNTLFSKERLYDEFLFGREGPYSPEDIRLTVKALQDLYGTYGYLDATVNVQLSARAEAAIYDIALTIEEGPQYTVGLVKVFGNTSTQTKVILHESLLCPGDVFDNRRLEGTEGRLKNTGFFRTVNVYAVRSHLDDPEDRYRDVYIEVEETDTGSFGLFGGFSSLDRVFGGVEITERNFRIAGISHLFDVKGCSLRGGGEFAHAKISIGDKQTSYLAQWTKPYFLDTPWILGVELEKSDNRVYSEGYEIKTYGGDVHSTYILNDYLKYDIFYRARHTSVAVSDRNNPLLMEEGRQQGFISSLGNALIYDSTDNPRRASCGFRSRLSYELAGIGGNYQFMKVAYLNTYYLPLSAKGVLKMRGELQFIKTYGSTTRFDLPLSERLFLGGETTVRGYRPFVIGPKFGSGEPRGGVSSLLLSEEYQYNLLKNPCLDGFVFVDAGYVSLSEFTIGRWAASVGLGIRFEIMKNMPLMMGYGWPIHPVEHIGGRRINNAQRFFFAMGGSF